MLHDPLVFQRFEYKYSIPASLIDPICAFIRPYCRMDEFAERERDKFYTIRTLYLDSRGFKTYWDTEHGVPNRFKLRVRTYGTDSSGPIKFEVKRRFNDVFLKTSIIVPGEEWRQLLTQPIQGYRSSLSRAEGAAFETFIRQTRILQARPKMLVRYERLAFRSHIDKYVRISFDRHICHQPKEAYELEGQKAEWFYNDDCQSFGETGSRVVLELKFTQKAPVWLCDLVRRFGLVRRSFSKYGTAMRRTLQGEREGSEFALAVPARSTPRNGFDGRIN